jgi:cytochrome c
MERITMEEKIMMKKISWIIGPVLLAANLCATAADMGSPDEAKAMSQKAAALVNQTGEAAFDAFAAEDGGFLTKDLYVFCMDLEGMMLSHAKKPDLVGKNLKDFNKYGDYLFQDMIAVASSKGEGWVDYKWPYPGSEEIKEKTSYIIKNEKGFFCGVGAYK